LLINVIDLYANLERFWTPQTPSRAYRCEKLEQVVLLTKEIHKEFLAITELRDSLKTVTAHSTVVSPVKPRPHSVMPLTSSYDDLANASRDEAVPPLRLRHLQTHISSFSGGQSIERYRLEKVKAMLAKRRGLLSVVKVVMAQRQLDMKINRVDLQQCRLELEQLKHKNLRQMSSTFEALLDVYPIEIKNTPTGLQHTIRGLILPRKCSELTHAAVYSDECTSTALGYVAHFTILASQISKVPLRYRVSHYGSRSYIIDQFDASGEPISKPLHANGPDKARFLEAIELLNKDIEQVRRLEEHSLTRDSSYSMPTDKVYR